MRREHVDPFGYTAASAQPGGLPPQQGIGGRIRGIINSLNCFSVPDAELDSISEKEKVPEDVSNRVISTILMQLIQ